jgi:hypothetical protein
MTTAGDQTPKQDKAAPWDSSDVISPSLDARKPTEDFVTRDDLFIHYRLPRPGSPSNAVRMDELILFKPTNTGTCPCYIFIASIDEFNHAIEVVGLAPDESLVVYEAAPGAAYIAVAASGNCTTPDCFCQLTISIPVA